MEDGGRGLVKEANERTASAANGWYPSERPEAASKSSSSSELLISTTTFPETADTTYTDQCLENYHFAAAGLQTFC